MRSTRKRRYTSVIDEVVKLSLVEHENQSKKKRASSPLKMIPAPVSHSFYDFQSQSVPDSPMTPLQLSQQSQEDQPLEEAGNNNKNTTYQKFPMLSRSPLVAEPKSPPLLKVSSKRVVAPRMKPFASLNPVLSSHGSIRAEKPTKESKNQDKRELLSNTNANAAAVRPVVKAIESPAEATTDSVPVEQVIQESPPEEQPADDEDEVASKLVTSALTNLPSPLTSLPSPLSGTDSDSKKGGHETISTGQTVSKPSQIPNLPGLPPIAVNGVIKSPQELFRTPASRPILNNPSPGAVSCPKPQTHDQEKVVKADHEAAPTQEGKGKHQNNTVSLRAQSAVVEEGEKDEDGNVTMLQTTQARCPNPTACTPSLRASALNNNQDSKNSRNHPQLWSFHPPTPLNPSLSPPVASLTQESKKQAPQASSSSSVGSSSSIKQQPEHMKPSETPATTTTMNKSDMDISTSSAMSMSNLDNNNSTSKPPTEPSNKKNSSKNHMREFLNSLLPVCSQSDDEDEFDSSYNTTSFSTVSTTKPPIYSTLDPPSSSPSVHHKGSEDDKGKVTPKATQAEKQELCAQTPNEHRPAITFSGNEQNSASVALTKRTRPVVSALAPLVASTAPVVVNTSESTSSNTPKTGPKTPLNPMISSKPQPNDNPLTSTPVTQYVSPLSDEPGPQSFSSSMNTAQSVSADGLPQGLYQALARHFGGEIQIKLHLAEIKIKTLCAEVSRVESECHTHQAQRETAESKVVELEAQLRMSQTAHKTAVQKLNSLRQLLLGN